jgi:hypothetical protein
MDIANDKILCTFHTNIAGQKSKLTLNTSPLMNVYIIHINNGIQATSVRWDWLNLSTVAIQMKAKTKTAITAPAVPNCQ